MPKFGMVVDTGRCLNCKACVVACKAENSVATGVSRNWVSETEAGHYPQIAVRVEPGQCMHCENAPCVRVCPTGASYMDRDGVVLLTADDCIGCRYCITACPYDARYLDEQSGTVDKCTFCRHRIDRGLAPACVLTCPTKARTFGDLEDPQSAVSQMVATRAATARHPEAGTRPKLLYIS